jgi:Spy/CpxP family protein refolding chaperone
MQSHHGCGCGGRESRGWRKHFEHHHYPGAESGTAFGVRRPLRFLAWKLGLDEAQVAGLADVLSALKTERAQSEVDQRRTLGAYADAVSGDTFDSAKADEAVTERVKSGERLEREVRRAVERIHALLTADQRARLAYLIRTGAVML